MKPTDIKNPDYFHKVVDCQWACPAHTPVPEYIRLIAHGRYSDAYMINWKSNVFPGILGRTCDRPCEPACRRGRVEDETLVKGNGMAEAKKLLAESGYDGTPIVVMHPTDLATITIGSDGRVSPATVTVNRGGRVTMVNNETGEQYPNLGECVEVVEPSRLVFREPAVAGMQTAIDFIDRGDGTTLCVTTQTNVPAMYRSPEAQAGMEAAFGELDRYLATLT